MIRFKLVGIGELELNDDFNFSFQYNNSIFSFDSLALNRSGEFQIPVTPTNNRILGFSNDPNKQGIEVRKKFAAELYYSGGKINGTLLVGKNYSAIFVYGELEALKRANEKGIIKNYCSFPHVLDTGTEIQTGAYASNGLLAYDFKFYAYKNGIAESEKLVDYVNIMPTVKLKLLLDYAKSACGINVDTSTLGNSINSIGVILSSNTASPTITTANLSGRADASVLTNGSSYFDLTTKVFKFRTGALTWQNKTVRVLSAKVDCTVTMKSSPLASVAAANGTGSTFLADDGGTLFPSLSVGESFDLKKGDYFTFVSSTDYFNSRIPQQDFRTSVNINFDVYSGDASTVEKGDVFPLQYNLPELTFVDLIKIIANVYRCGIEYNPLTNTVSFFNYSFDKSDAYELDNYVIDIKSVDRSFINYAAKNIVEYKSEDYIVNRYKTTYPIDNANLTSEKILYTIPFSEGIRGLNAFAELKDFELTAPYKYTGKTPTIAVASKIFGYNFMNHISKLYENFSIPNNLKDIIFNSTTVVMSVKMDVKTFLSIKNRWVFKYRGLHYCLISGTQNNGIAELTLVKI